MTLKIRPWTELQITFDVCNPKRLGPRKSELNGMVLNTVRENAFRALISTVAYFYDSIPVGYCDAVFHRRGRSEPGPTLYTYPGCRCAAPWAFGVCRHSVLGSLQRRNRSSWNRLVRACCKMSRRDRAILAWHEVPGTAPPKRAVP
jgi:hypothetical protein